LNCFFGGVTQTQFRGFIQSEDHVSVSDLEVQAGCEMTQLQVGTHTTPIELAAFCRKLHADDTISGKPGKDGELILYVNPTGRNPGLRPSMEEQAVTRVAVEVVLHPMTHILGSELALRHVQSALNRPRRIRVGDIAGPLNVLANLYDNAVEHNRVEGMHPETRVHFVRKSDGSGGSTPLRQSAEDMLSDEQRDMLDSLIMKLMALSERKP
jgi:hypothetical protein